MCITKGNERTDEMRETMKKEIYKTMEKIGYNKDMFKITDEMIELIMNKFDHTTNWVTHYIVHLTHNDADGVGCGFLGNIGFTHERLSEENSCGVTFHIPATTVMDYLALVMTVLKVGYRKYPKLLIVSDLNFDPQAFLNILDVLNFQNHIYPIDSNTFEIKKQSLDNNCMFFLHVDHHVTNKVYQNFLCEEFDYDEYRNMHGEKECRNLISMVKGSYVYPTANHPYEEMKGAKISATYIMYKVLSKLFMDDSWYLVTNLYNIKSILRDEDYHDAVKVFSQLISQWDTFEWRDHPEYNINPPDKWYSHDYIDKNMERDVMMLLSINKPYELVELFVDEIEHSNGAYLGVPFYRFNEKTLNELHDLKASYKDELKYYLDESNGRWTDQLFKAEDGTNIHSLIIPAPEKFASLIFHDMMTMRSDFKQKMEESNGYVLVAGFYIKKTQLSLRTTSDKFSVADIAKRNGGGGHKQAAGYVPVPRAMLNILAKWLGIDNLKDGDEK